MQQKACPATLVLSLFICWCWLSSFKGALMPSTLVMSRLWNQVGTKTSLQDAYFLCGIAVLLVGLAGFEPTTSCPPDKRANQAAPQPAFDFRANASPRDTVNRRELS